MQQFFNEISIEKGISPAFIEKDFYVVEIIKILSTFESENLHIEFSGGTSLSKGFGIINRFSEDIDFMIQATDEVNKKFYRNIRKDIFSAINKNDFFYISEEPEDLIIRDESKFFSFYVNYPILFEKQYSRPQVKIEISAKPIKLDPEKRSIVFWVNEYLHKDEKVNINCISPLETAANKFSAFLWRVDCKNRNSDDKKYNDPTIIRHLYDLFALRNVINSNKQRFFELIFKIYEADKKRGNKENNLSLKEFVFSALDKINHDVIYKIEYNNFVNHMIYKQTDIIDYEIVKNYFSELILSLFS